MTEPSFKPVFYFKQNCPFCLKIRLFLLESGMVEAVDIRDFIPGSRQEEEMRAELRPHLARLSFPAAQLEPGRYVAESDEIIALLAEKSGREPENMPVFSNYVEGPLKTMMDLWKENQQLKAAAT
jgi:glutathione S-transferase